MAATGQRCCRGPDGNHSGSGGQAGCGEAVHLASLTVLEQVWQGWVGWFWYGHQHHTWQSSGGESAVMHCIGALTDCR